MELPAIPTDSATALVAIVKPLLPTILAADQNDILGKLREELAGFVPDVSTATGRTEIGSKAKKIGVAKMELVRLAGTLKEDAAKKVKAINAEVKSLEERMDALRDSVLEPLEAFKAREKARVDSHEAALAAIVEAPEYGQTETAAEIAERLEFLRNYPHREWEEFAARANYALKMEIARMSDLFDRAQKRDRGLAGADQHRGRGQAAEDAGRQAQRPIERRDRQQGRRRRADPDQRRPAADRENIAFHA